MKTLEKEIKKIDRIKNINEKKQFIIDLISNYEYKTKLKIINELINEEQDKYKRLNRLKNYYLKNNKTKKLKMTNIKLAKQKEICDLLIDINKQIKKANKNEGFITLELDYSQIISIDDKINCNSLSLINKINSVKSSKKRLEYIVNLKELYENSIKYIDNKKMISSLNRIINYLDMIIQKQYYMKVPYIINIINIKDKTKEKDKLKTRTLSSKTEKNKVAAKNVNSNKNHRETLEILNEPIYNEILNGKSVSMYTLSDVIETFCEVVRKYEINRNLINVVNEIIDRLDLETEYEKSLDYLYSMIDSSKIRKYGFNKDEDEFKILKEICKILKQYKNRIDLLNTDISDDETYKFDLISSLLYDENNYFLIKRILNDNKTIVNSKKKNKHIIIYILELYLENHKMLLNKDTEKYIKIDFLKEIYYLFTKNSYLRLDEDTKKVINKKIYNFIVSLTNDKSKQEFVLDGEIINPIFVKSDKRRKSIIEEVKQLSTHYYYNSPKYDLKKLNECQLENQISYAYNNNHIQSRTDQIDLTDEENIILDNEYIAYNYKSTKDSNILRVSVCDMSILVPDDSSLNSYVYNQLIMKNPLDQRILDKLKFDNGKESFAITFKILLDKNNRPISLYIYKSKIKPTYYNEENSDMYKGILNAVNEIIKIKKYEVDNYEHLKIQEVIRKVINELYIDIAIKKDIPFTYSGVEKISDIEPNVYSIVSSISSKLPKEEFTSIYNIIINNLGEFHYSSEQFPVEGDFDLNLIGEPNYILLENQRLIKSLLINELSLKPEQYDRKKRIYCIEHKNMIIDLNNALDHKDIEDFEYGKRKIKTKIIKI